MKVSRIWMKPFRHGAWSFPGAWHWEVEGAGFVTSGSTRADAIRAWREIRQLRRRWR